MSHNDWIACTVFRARISRRPSTVDYLAARGLGDTNCKAHMPIHMSVHIVSAHFHGHVRLALSVIIDFVSMIDMNDSIEGLHISWRMDLMVRSRRDTPGLLCQRGFSHFWPTIGRSMPQHPPAALSLTTAMRGPLGRWAAVPFSAVAPRRPEPQRRCEGHLLRRGNYLE